MLDARVRELAQGPNFAVTTTVNPDGSLQSLVTWIDADDEYLYVNTETERQRARNARRDPRITVVIFDGDSWWGYVEVRGRVVDVIGGDQARAHIDTVARKYTGKPYANPIGSERVMLKIAPDRQRV
jgi:PPOX class probable F420-dependent enzyme